MSQLDHVTGLEPRGALEAFFDRHGALPGALAMVMCDVVGLKEINAREGFLAGDACLQLAARRLRDATPDAAIRGRLGGDELVAVFTGPSAAAAADRAMAMLAASSNPPLRSASILRAPDEPCGRLVERLYAIVRRS